MKCPHCGTAINVSHEVNEFSTEDEKTGDPIIALDISFCPECSKPIINMEYGKIIRRYPNGSPCWEAESSQLIFPQTVAVRILSKHIPSMYQISFHEAERVLPISAKASATLSRYLLQMILHEELKIKKRNLDEELQELENSSSVPTSLVTILQIMRKIANFGAHPKKSTNSAEIIDVEPHEAEVMLDLIEELFDYVFVKPAQKQEFIRMAKEKYGVEV